MSPPRTYRLRSRAALAAVVSYGLIGLLAWAMNGDVAVALFLFGVISAWERGRG